jgi:hypothetical protein
MLLYIYCNYYISVVDLNYFRWIWISEKKLNKTLRIRTENEGSVESNINVWFLFMYSQK